MELTKEVVVTLCLCTLAFCACAGLAIAVMGVLLGRAMGHLTRAEARSREMAMSVCQDWRDYRRAELEAEGPGEPETPPPPSGDSILDEIQPIRTM